MSKIQDTGVNPARQPCEPAQLEKQKGPKAHHREVLGLDDFTFADIAAFEASRPPPESMAFDDELRQ